MRCAWRAPDFNAGNVFVASNMAHENKPGSEKKPGSKEPGLKYWPREADTITFQEGLLSLRVAGGGGQMRNANAQRRDIMVRMSTLQQLPGKHVSHAETGGFRQRKLRRPALCFAHHEIAENLHPRHCLQFFRIDEICVELDRIRFAEQLHQTIIFLDQIVRQRRDPEPLLTRAHQAENVVDLEIGFARTGAVAAGFDQPTTV